MSRLGLYVAFTLSGAAGLIYETIWSRYLALFVGHSAYAQVIVLSIFLGGMALGAVLVGQRSERLREPLLWYAGVELVVGLIGLCFHRIYWLVTDLSYEILFPHLGGAAALTAVKWSIASALILPQSLLLGMTFPFISAALLRRSRDQPGRVLAVMYFTNSIGAAAGALVAGFYLVSAVGLPGTILAAAVTNCIVAALSYLIARSLPLAPSATLAVGEPASGGDHAVVGPRALWFLLLGISFGTAVASFIYEIAWIRMLSLVLGSATHSFELMLSAFILGLALGAFWLRGRADRFSRPLLALGLVQWIMGAAALATLPVYVSSFGWMATLLHTFTRTAEGYLAFNLARYGICLAVMLPSTFCAGMTLPLITRTLLAGGSGERSIGWVYGVNTFGAIVGVVLASLVLLPRIGLKTLLVSGAAMDMALGVLLFAFAVRRGGSSVRLVFGSAVAAALGVLLVAQGVRLDRALLVSGVYRTAALPGDDRAELLFYADGRTATVAAGRNKKSGSVFISTNGKGDASLTREWFEGVAPGTRVTLSGDSATQVLLPMMTLAHVPAARRAAVIGHGSGMSSHFLLGSRAIEQVVTIEIEPAMIGGSRVFYPANARVFDDPRSAFVIDDAKSFFAADEARYDLILSEPSNPWVSGVASLFTREFYARVADRLSETGVFGQWLHVYEFNDDLLLSILAAIHERFSSYQVFVINSADILIVASRMARLPSADWSVFDLQPIADELRSFMPLEPDTLEAMRTLERETLDPLMREWKVINSDYFPIVDLGAERARYMRQTASGLGRLNSGLLDFTAPFLGRRTKFRADPREVIVVHERLGMLARSAAARAVFDRDEAPGIEIDQELEATLDRVWQWKNGILTGRPPLSWNVWARQTVQIEEDLHQGSAGVVHERFYESLHAYLDRNPPPLRVCAAVTFLEAIRRWDFAAADGVGASLVEAAAGRSLIPAHQLLAGVVPAALAAGDPVAASDYVERLSGRLPSDLWLKLLRSFTRVPDRLTRPGDPVRRVSWRCPASAEA